MQDAVDISDVFNKARLDMITAPKADESRSCEAFRLQFMLGRPVPRHWSMLCCVLSFRDMETFRFQGFFFSFHFIGDHIFSHHLDPRAGNVPETMRFALQHGGEPPRHRIARYCRLRRQDIGPTRPPLTDLQIGKDSIHFDQGLGGPNIMC